MALYSVNDGNAYESADSWAELVEQLQEWFDFLVVVPADAPEALAEAVHSLDLAKIAAGDLEGLQGALNEWQERIAEAMGYRSWAGHGNYYVSAAAAAGLSLTVTTADPREWGAAAAEAAFPGPLSAIRNRREDELDVPVGFDTEACRAGFDTRWGELAEAWAEVWAVEAADARADHPVDWPDDDLGPDAALGTPCTLAELNAAWAVVRECALEASPYTPRESQTCRECGDAGALDATHRCVRCTAREWVDAAEEECGGPGQMQGTEWHGDGGEPLPQVLVRALEARAARELTLDERCYFAAKSAYKSPPRGYWEQAGEETLSGLFQAAQDLLAHPDPQTSPLWYDTVLRDEQRLAEGLLRVQMGKTVYLAEDQDGPYVVWGVAHDEQSRAGSGGTL